MLTGPASRNFENKCLQVHWTPMKHEIYFLLFGTSIFLCKNFQFAKVGLHLSNKKEKPRKTWFKIKRYALARPGSYRSEVFSSVVRRPTTEMPVKFWVPSAGRPGAVLVPEHFLIFSLLHIQCFVVSLFCCFILSLFRILVTFIRLLRGQSRFCACSENLKF